jgi:hypothetical protein
MGNDRGARGRRGRSPAPNLPGLPVSQRTLDQLLDRAGRADYDTWAAQIAGNRGCAHPIRLAGRSITAAPDTGEITGTYSTDDQPDRILLNACRARRATVCPSCATIYQGDARALVAGGLAGADHQTRPVVFATLTAPSFGAVHASHSQPGPCHTLPDPRCGHRPAHTCRTIHPEDDPILGTPICPDSYDYDATIIWNNRAGELWRRTIITARRQLAAAAGLTARAFSSYHTLAYVKVVEYQQRGVIHIHALLRADPAPDVAPLTADQLAAALGAAAATTTAPNPHRPDNPIRWGAQTRIDPIPASERRRAVAYVTKYTTKSVDTGGALDHPLRHRPDDATGLPPHLHTLAAAAWDLGGRPDLAELNLRSWAHTLGYRGHWLTKSRTWSTTLTALRARRHQWQLTNNGHDPDAVTTGQWAYTGQGHATAGDDLLAATTATTYRHQRRTAWEER